MATISVRNHWVSFSVREYVCNGEFTGSPNHCMGRLHIRNTTHADAAQTFRGQGAGDTVRLAVRLFTGIRYGIPRICVRNL